MKKLNLDWGPTSTQRVNELNLLDVFRLKAYEIKALYKEKIHKYHDQRVEKQGFVVCDLVLLFNYKLKSKWSKPFLLKHVFPHGVADLENSEGTRFKVKGQRIKLYLGNVKSVLQVIGAYYIDEV